MRTSDMGYSSLTTEDSLLMAYAFYKLKNYRRMLSLTLDALKKKPDHPLALHYYALALRGLGDLRGAEKIVMRLLEDDKDSSSHLFLFGIIRWNTGESESAEEFMKKAIKISSKEASFHLQYAIFLIHHRRFEEALDAAYKAKSIDNSLAKANDVISSARQKEIREDFEEIVYEPPLPFSGDSEIPYNKLGDFYLNSSRISSAQMQYAQALHRNPKNIHAMGGFATAVRLEEDKVYHSLNNLALFLVKLPVLLSLVLILLVVAIVTWKDPVFRSYAAALGVLIISVISFILVKGFKRKTNEDFNLILKEWKLDNTESLVRRTFEIQAEKTDEYLKRESAMNRAREMNNYAGFFSAIGLASLVIQVFIVNVNIEKMDVNSQDKISMVKTVLFILIIVCMGLAIYFRTNSGSLDAAGEDYKKMKTAKNRPF